MTNYPEPIEIPEGKILVEDHPAPERMAKREILETGTHRLWGTIASLVWCSPGFEPAGSSCLWTNGYWAVRYPEKSGATHGRRFENDEAGEAKAREFFSKVTHVEEITPASLS